MEQEQLNGIYKEELQEIDRKSRKIMTMNKELHPRSDVARIYVPRKKGERGVISCESCARREENSLSWYVRNSEEALLRKVGDSPRGGGGVLDISLGGEVRPGSSYPDPV